MKTPELDKKTKKEIIKQLKSLAEAYTPEWRFDEENPDVGTALALIFGEMQEDNLKKFNQVSAKNMLEFFRAIGTTLETAQPASGYVSFGLVNEDVEGSELRRGTRLLGTSSDGQEDVIFETVNDVYATPAAIQNVYQICPKEDGIYHFYDRERDSEEQKKPFRLFGGAGENEQLHRVYICHDHAFYMEREGSLRLKFLGVRNTMLPDALVSALVDGEVMEYAYLSQEGFVPFARVEEQGGDICLYKSSAQPPSVREEREGKASYWIRLTCRKIDAVKNLALSGILLSAEGERIYPDLILAGGTEQEKREYLPFGEQMGLYEELYFASEQVLSQKGAEIHLQFRMNFMRIPTESFGQKEIDWKWIMKREEFIPEPEYDIHIGEVIWEYFNGKDWRKLPESSHYATVFSPSHGTMGKMADLVFQCPHDIEPILVHSANSYYIRARIVKMHNMYRWNGQYIPPVLSDTRLSFSYRHQPPVPGLVIAENNGEKNIWRQAELLDGEKTLRPYRGLEEEFDSVYVGFDRPIDRGPVRIYIRLLEQEMKSGRNVSYEYFTGRKWKALSLADGTEGLKKSGILTFLGSPDFKKSELWGKEHYWIRIQDKGLGADPVIQSIHMNATEILAVETRDIERFFVEPNQKNAVFTLTGKNINELHIWVKEQQGISSEQLKALEEQYRVRIQDIENGAEREIWTEWKEVENFADSTPEDRHYMADKNEGILKFPDGVRGKIPDSGTEESVWVEYKCGGGTEGNLPAGAIQRLNETVGYVNRVNNPMPTAGGTDQENVEEAIRRKGSQLRHRGRAVTKKDYEALVMESEGSIVKVKCCPNCTETGKHQPGHVTVAVLMDHHYENQEFFEPVKRKCLSYMKKKIPDFLLEENWFHVIKPDFVELTVIAQIEVSDIQGVLDTRSQVLNRLDQFLNPMTGNFHGMGWQIGELPNHIQILNLLRSIEGIGQVRSLRLMASVLKNGQRKEMDMEEAGQLKFAVAVGRGHEIHIVSGGALQ